MSLSLLNSTISELLCVLTTQCCMARFSCTYSATSQVCTYLFISFGVAVWSTNYSSCKIYTAILSNLILAYFNLQTRTWYGICGQNLDN